MYAVATTLLPCHIGRERTACTVVPPRMAMVTVGWTHCFVLSFARCHSWPGSQLPLPPGFVTLEVRTLHAGGVYPFDVVVSTWPCTQLPLPHVRFAALGGCTHTLGRGLVSGGYGHYRFAVLHCPGVAWCAHVAMYAVVAVLAASYRMWTHS